MNNFNKESKNVNTRTVHNLCPNCFSTLEIDDKGRPNCTSDRLQYWKEAAKEYTSLNSEEQKKYLNTLSNPSGFLNVFDPVTGEISCDLNLVISSITPRQQTRIPDPLAVARLERTLKRNLTQIELEEGYEFPGGLRLPFLNFPEDL